MSACAKVSVTIAKDKLRMLKKRARRLHGGNLSAVIDEATEHLRRLEALGDFLERVDAPRLKPEELSAIETEWRGAAKPKRPSHLGS